MGGVKEVLHSIAFVATFWEAFSCCLRNVRHRSGAVSMSLTEDSLWPSESRNSAVSLVGVGVLLSTAGDEVLYVAAYPAPAPLFLIHISEPTRPLSTSYAVFCFKKKILLHTHNTVLHLVSPLLLE